MIEDLLIINESGALLYNWHPKDFVSDGKEDLLSGFLTAINSFATVERGEDIKSLKLKETQIIFERYDKLHQKLTFVITTKNEELIDILHAILHELMEEFPKQFFDDLNREFNGLISEFRKFDSKMEEIIRSYALDVIDNTIREVDKAKSLNAAIYLEPIGGHVFYIYAKHYVNKDKISFLIPLIMRSAKFLYNNSLHEHLNWILLNTVGNEILLVEPREKILIIKQFESDENYEELLLSSEFFKEKSKYVRKPEKLITKFESVNWNQKIKQIYLVDIFGKILHSKIFDETYDCIEYIPETISFLTSSKKTSEEIFSRALFNAIIAGTRIITICLNFNNFCLTLIGNSNDLTDIDEIQRISKNIFQQFM
ncbi:MAG: hypothetical protein ACFFE4_15995 [Candidatus Thorarchaeota archaeon]